MKNNPDDGEHLSAQDVFSALSKNDLKTLGLGDIAYIKRHTVNGRPIFILHAADGERLMTQNDEISLQRDARRHDLNLIALH